MEFLAKNSLYVVLICVLVIWAGIAWYIQRVDRKVTELEKKIQ